MGRDRASTTRVIAAQRNVLIEDGILTDYMWDFLRARKEGRLSSGNGRRQSYQHLPMVRMTNTFVLNGTEEPDEIIRQTERGVYVAHLGGGQVNTATGDFVFGMTEAYLIENGEITDPLREGNLIGNGPEVLRNIDARRQRLRHGQPGNVRQGRPGRAGGRRPADAAGHRSHHRRHRGVSELLDVARRVADQAKPGEQVEAYVAALEASERARLSGRGRGADVSRVVGHRRPGDRRQASGVRPRGHPRRGRDHRSTVRGA